MQSFCTSDLSSFYLDILKDRLYTEGRSSPLRQATQALLKVIAQSLASILSPITPFLTKEIASQLGLSDTWPKIEVFDFDSKHYDSLLLLRNRFMEAYGSTLRAHFHCKSTFSLDVTVIGQCGISDCELTELLQVARVQRDCKPLSNAVTIQINPELALHVTQSDRHKCPRCWTFNAENEDLPCPRCQEQLFAIPVDFSKEITINKQVEA